MYHPKAIANYFIELANRHDANDLSPMKLQKLIYYAQGWSLAVFDKPLFNEQIEAWRFGPVVPSIFQAAKSFGMAHISKPLADYALIDGAIIPQTPKIDLGDDPATELLDTVWSIYGHFSAVQLSNMTHEPGSPWDIVNQQYAGNIPLNTDIDQNIIKSWFTNELKKPAGGG